MPARRSTALGRTGRLRVVRVLDELQRSPDSRTAYV
jgi:hypothetical protein